MSTSHIPPLLTACSEFKILFCLPASLVSVTHIPTSLLSSWGGNPYLTSLHLYFSPISWYFPCPMLSPADRLMLQPGHDGLLPRELPQGRVGQSSLVSCHLLVCLEGLTEQLGEPPQDSCHQNATIKTQHPMDQPWRYSDPNWPPCSWSPCSRRGIPLSDPQMSLPTSAFLWGWNCWAPWQWRRGKECETTRSAQSHGGMLWTPPLSIRPVCLFVCLY